MQIVNFKQWKCRVVFSSYQYNLQPAILLEDDDTGERIATATVCLPDHEFQPGQTAVKDYSENEGMLRCLVDAGIVADTGERVPTGYVEVPIVQLVEQEKDNV